MQKNLKKREFLEADKQLAQNLYLAARNDQKFQHLVAPYGNWLQDINDQLANYDQPLPRATVTQIRPATEEA